MLVLSGESEGTALDLLDKALSLVTVSYWAVSTCLSLFCSLLFLSSDVCILPSSTGTHEHRQHIAMATTFNQLQMPTELCAGDQQTQGLLSSLFSK
jgi:hypothetical protein